MTAARSYPPVLDPSLSGAGSGIESRHANAYRAHLRSCAPELVEHAAEVSHDRALRLCMLTLRELRERRLDLADAILAEAEPLTDWESIAEARRGR